MTNLFTNLSKNGSEPVNGSRMDRHNIENGPMKMRKICAVLVMMLCLGVGNMWGGITTYTFTSKSWAATSGGSAANWASTKDGCEFANNGIKCTTTASNNNAVGTSPVSFSNVTRVVVTYNTNMSQGAGNLKVKIGTNSEVSNSVGYSGSSDGRSANFTTTFNFSPGQSGNVQLTINTTTNSLYVVSIAITETPSDPYTVSFSTGTGNPSQANIAEASGGAGITLPNVTPTCSGDGWALYGWATSACSSETSTAPTIVGKAGDTYYPTSATTLYAVYAKGEYTKITSTSDLNTTSKYFFASVYSTKNYVMTSSCSSNKLAAKQIDETSSGKYHAALINADWCYTLESSSSKWFIVDCNSSNSNHYLDTYYDAWYGHEKDSYDSYTFAYSSSSWTITNSYGSNKYFGYSSSDGAFKPFSSAQNLQIYKQTTTPSYYGTPTCCTPLGSINGSVSWSNAATAVVGWHKDAHASSYTLQYKTHAAGAWTDKWTTKVPGTDAEISLTDCVGSSVGANDSCYATISSLAPCTDYDFKITANPSSGYCNKDQTIEDSQTHRYSVSFPTLTGTTKLTGNTYACASAAYTATFEASSAAYDLPDASGVTVTIGGSTATEGSGKDYTWSVSLGVGTVTIPAAKQTGAITISIVSVAQSCTATPTLGTASLSGTFNLSTVGVSCASITPGSNCAVESGDYGFIWYAGTGDKVIGNDGVTKVAISSGDYSSGSFAATLSGSFTNGSTYSYRAFAENTGGNVGYSTTATFKPQSVTFNSNGGSSVDTKYVNNGGTVSAPTDPTKTGYTFDSWRTTSGLGTAMNFSGTITTDTTLYAKWNAKQSTITFDKNSGTGGSDGATGTYDSAMPDITPPTRSGYTFAGYWDAETDNNGSGTMYYKADGTSNKDWDKNTTSGTTLYAKWTAKVDVYKSELHTGVTAWEDYASGVNKEGAGYTIPNPGDIAAGDREGTGCEGKHYHFAGWVTDANKEAGTISGNIIEATGTKDATGTTYWAVWEKESDSSTPVTYTKVTTISEGTYLMATMTNAQYVHQTTFAYAGKKANNAVPPAYVWGDTIPVSISTGVISSKPATAKEITVTLDDKGYFGMYDGEKYLTMTSKGKFTFADVVSYEWELNSNAYIHNKGNYDSSTEWMIILNNGNSGSPSAYFVPMKDKEEGNNSGSYYYHAFLFKKAGGIVYDDPKVECICSANPSAGTAAVDATGTFSASKIDVKATSASTGHADCSYTDYGFVWSTSVSAAADLKLVEGTGAAATNCTKVQVGTSGEVTSFTGSLTGSFTANPIYFRSYVKNGKADGTYQYSSVVTINPRSVTFNLNGHGSSTPAAQLVNNGSKATDPSYAESVTGYIFGGWYKEVGCSNVWTFGTDVVSGENKTLYAKWTPITYSVRFNSNDANYLGTATGSMSDQSFDYDESKDLTGINFSLAGYDFAGWALTPTGDVEHLDEAEVENLSSTNSAVVNLYAIWTAKKYNVTLAATDETSSVGSQTVQATYNAAMPLVTTADGTPAVAAPSRTGYTFTGWEYSSTTYYNYNAGTSTLSSAHAWDQPNSTTTLTPKWSINSYTLTWNLAGGTVSVAGTGAAVDATGTPSSSVAYNSAITVPTVTKAGYTFAGWNTTPASNMPASNTTYTASWTALHDKYYDRMHENGASTEAVTGYKYDDKSGAGYTIPKPSDKDGSTGNIQCEKDHYKFVGWVAASDMNDDGTLKSGYTIIAGGGTTDATGTTYYAVWAEEE